MISPFGKIHVMSYGHDGASHWLVCSCGERSWFASWEQLAAWRDEHGRT